MLPSAAGSCGLLLLTLCEKTKAVLMKSVTSNVKMMRGPNLHWNIPSPRPGSGFLASRLLDLSFDSAVRAAACVRFLLEGTLLRANTTEKKVFVCARSGD